MHFTMEGFITDSKTNTVSFSSLITRFRVWKDLKLVLKKKNIKYSFIDGTKDIWVRDFMPVQITESRYTQFYYKPSYLDDKPEYLTDYYRYSRYGHYLGTSFCKDLKVDGGNIIKCDDCVIMTDKVFSENSEKSRKEIMSTLEELMGCEILIIPHDPEEETGHADGMLRYIGNNTILLNHYYDFDKPLRKKLLNVLTPHFNVAELHLDTDRYLATSWAYINYLQVGNHVIVPAVNKRLDEMAIKQLEAYLHLEIDSVPALGIVRLGGGLNCASWTRWDGLLWANEQIKNHIDIHSEY